MTAPNIQFSQEPGFTGRVGRPFGLGPIEQSMRLRQADLRENVGLERPNTKRPNPFLQALSGGIQQASRGLLPQVFRAGEQGQFDPADFNQETMSPEQLEYWSSLSRRDKALVVATRPEIFAGISREDLTFLINGDPTDFGGVEEDEFLFREHGGDLLRTSARTGLAEVARAGAPVVEKNFKLGGHMFDGTTNKIIASDPEARVKSFTLQYAGPGEPPDGLSNVIEVPVISASGSAAEGAALYNQRIDQGYVRKEKVGGSRTAGDTLDISPFGTAGAFDRAREQAFDVEQFISQSSGFLKQIETMDPRAFGASGRFAQWAGGWLAQVHRGAGEGLAKLFSGMNLRQLQEYRTQAQMMVRANLNTFVGDDSRFTDRDLQIANRALAALELGTVDEAIVGAMSWAISSSIMRRDKLRMLRGEEALFDLEEEEMRVLMVADLQDSYGLSLEIATETVKQNRLMRRDVRRFVNPGQPAQAFPQSRNQAPLPLTGP